MSHRINVEDNWILIHDPGVFARVLKRYPDGAIEAFYFIDGIGFRTTVYPNEYGPWQSAKLGR